MGLSLPAHARVGTRLAEARRADLFTFFKLEEVSRQALPQGLTAIDFKPAGPRFRPLVTVTVTVDASESILAMRAWLLRSFVEDRVQHVFADDLAKSFLRGAVPGRDDLLVQDLANEIEHRPPLGGRRLVVRDAPRPRLPASPTVGLQVYLGRGTSFQTVQGATRLRVENAAGTPPGVQLTIEQVR